MKKSTRTFLLGFLTAIFATGPVCGQISSGEIDQLVNDAMTKFHVAGVALGIVKDGEIIHAKGYGVRSVETKEKVDEHTSFAIASNSKAFTSTALCLLVEEGKLSWQDRVIHHIPEFMMYNDYVTRNFNIQDLLTHRSGLGLGAGDLQLWPDGSDFTMADILSNFQHFMPVSAFRTKYDYDNILYLVAGEVIKRVSGMSWEDFVKTRIMDPLNMDHSSTLPPSLSSMENLASPHLEENGVLRTIPYYELDPEKINGAAGGILSNVDDMCQWMLVHLNKGKYGQNLEKQLFSVASQSEMWKNHTTLNINRNARYNSHFAGYGLGWRLTDMKGYLSVYHGGDLRGMLSKTIMIPDLDLGIVVLSNSYYGGEGVIEAVSRTIVDSYLGLENFGWIEKYIASFRNQSTRADAVVRKVWATVDSANDDHIHTDDYTGIYEDKWFGMVKVHMKGDQLWFSSMRSPKLTGPMYFYKANAFAVKWECRELNADAFAIFSLNEEGVAVSMKMKGISPDIDFSYDFQDLFFERSGDLDE